MDETKWGNSSCFLQPLWPENRDRHHKIQAEDNEGQLQSKADVTHTHCCVISRGVCVGVCMWRPNLQCSLSLAGTEIICTRERRTTQLFANFNTTFVKKRAHSWYDEDAIGKSTRVVMKNKKQQHNASILDENAYSFHHFTSISWCHEHSETSQLSTAEVSQAGTHSDLTLLNHHKVPWWETVRTSWLRL